MTAGGPNRIPMAALAEMVDQAPVGHVLIDRAMVVR